MNSIALNDATVHFVWLYSFLENFNAKVQHQTTTAYALCEQINNEAKKAKL